MTTADTRSTDPPAPAIPCADSLSLPAGPLGTALAALLPVALVAVFYRATAVELVRIWEIDPNYSHGFVVPVVCLLLGFLAWKGYGPLVRREVGWGASLVGTIEVAAGLALHVIAWLLGNLLLDVVSLIFVLRGLLLMLGGREVYRRFGFSVLFLIFMAPLPIAWYQPIAILMQQIVSAVSTQVLELCGAAVYREGYFIHLPGYTMEVGEACSGLRQLTAVVALAVVVGHLSGRSRVYRWTLAVAAFPIAIAANCFRVLLTGVILMLFGAKWAEGVFHTLEGLVVVGLAAVFLMAVAAGLGWIRGGEKSRTGFKPPPKANRG